MFCERLSLPNEKYSSLLSRLTACEGTGIKKEECIQQEHVLRKLIEAEWFDLHTKSFKTCRSLLATAALVYTDKMHTEYMFSGFRPELKRCINYIPKK